MRRIAPVATNRRLLPALLGLVLVLLCATGFVGRLASAEAQTAASFQDVRFVGGLTQPTAMAMAPDGRIFVAEQGGALRVVKNGALLATPFLTVPVVSNNERGLLGVTFDPAFASNGFVYVYYTANTNPIVNRVSRFTVSATDPDRANPSSEAIIVNDIPSENGYHNGGALHFGADGKLYVAVGESHTGSNAQSLTSLAGKILRFNSNGTVPTDNPFYASTTGNFRAIWALGLRNPFTFDIQPGTGRIFVNDVGQSTWEEIDEAWIGPNDGSNAGFNFGWPSTEGPTTNPSYHAPFHAYTHSDGCAITGGAFYNPPAANFPPEYFGDYFFADYCGGWVKSVDVSTKVVSTLIAPGDAGQPVDIKVGADGSLYYLDRALDPTASVHIVTFDQPLVAPVNTVRPALSGTAREGQTAHHLDRHLDRDRADHLRLLLAPLRHERIELRDDPRRQLPELRDRPRRRRLQALRARHRHERRGLRLAAQLPERDGARGATPQHRSPGALGNGSGRSDPHHLDRHLDRDRADHLRLLLAPLRREREQLRDDPRRQLPELRDRPRRYRLQALRARHRHERRGLRLAAQYLSGTVLGAPPLNTVRPRFRGRRGPARR